MQSRMKEPNRNGVAKRLASSLGAAEEVSSRNAPPSEVFDAFMQQLNRMGALESKVRVPDRP
jgi:hypothetical protein